MSADVSSDFIDTAFELLGHTGKTYVSNEDYIDFEVFFEDEKDEHGMNYVASVLVDLGIQNISNLEISDYFFGVQVGLETHRRKNVGGTAFVAIVEAELLKIVDSIRRRGFDIALEKEEVIYYSDKATSKTVDFCLRYKEQRIGIEVNFYTSSGSKPTEIKRSYGQVNGELEKVGVVLVWVTDGVGYVGMKKSLKEARDIHKNTYNFLMMKENFENDVMDAFGLGE